MMSYSLISKGQLTFLLNFIWRRYGKLLNGSKLNLSSIMQFLSVGISYPSSKKQYLKNAATRLSLRPDLLLKIS